MRNRNDGLWSCSPHAGQYLWSIHGDIAAAHTQSIGAAHTQQAIAAARPTGAGQHPAAHVQLAAEHSPAPYPPPGAGPQLLPVHCTHIFHRLIFRHWFRRDYTKNDSHRLQSCPLPLWYTVHWFLFEGILDKSLLQESDLLYKQRSRVLGYMIQEIHTIMSQTPPGLARERLRFCFTHVINRHRQGTAPGAQTPNLLPAVTGPCPKHFNRQVST